MNLIDENEELREFLHKIPGLFYLCPSCQEETINFTVNISHNLILNTVEEQPNLTKETYGKTLNTNQSSTRTPRMLPKLPIAVTPIIHHQNKQDASNEYLGRTESMKNTFQSEVKNKNALTLENKRTNEPGKIKESEEQLTKHNDLPICRFYKKGKCKHGIKGRNCQYYHPKACSKLMKYGNKGPKGCGAGIKCANYHPRMCASSIKQGQCLNEACTFTHVKGTRRKALQENTQNYHRSELEVFLKVLDNFKTEMITLINEKMKINTTQAQQIYPFPQLLNQTPGIYQTQETPHRTNLPMSLQYQGTHFQSQKPRVPER